MEVIRLVTELSELPTKAADLPESPIASLEPLLTVSQLCQWTGYSRSNLDKYRNRSEDPLLPIGTMGAPRFLPSEVIAWMRREYLRTKGAESGA